MNNLELILDSFATLATNKMRTSLAALGIIIGIGSVITLVSLGQSSQKSIENQIQSLGANLLTVIPGGVNVGGVRGAAGGASTLTLSDAAAIENSSQVTTVSLVSPEYQSRTQVIAGGNNINTQIVGVYPDYARVHDVTLSSGNFISQADVDALSKVAVLGSQAAIDLFGQGANAVGQTVRINGQNLVVIGVAASKGGQGFNNPDETIYVPLSTAQKELFGTVGLSSISVEAKSQAVMTEAENQIGYLLLSLHHLSNPSQADFSIFSQTDILNTANQVTGTFTALLGGIAAISLLVGGIGIMNIMLVTVTERTREIGLRKALGAKRRLIITQFLIEATILTVFGGLIGMVLGIGASYVISGLLSLPFTISLSSILLAIGVSGVIGIIFGWYPARQAASLQPIEALRYE